MEFNINEILSLFIIIIVFYLNLSTLQMKESLESGPLETIRIIIASWNLLGAGNISSSRVPVSIRLTSV